MKNLTCGDLQILLVVIWPVLPRVENIGKYSVHTWLDFNKKLKKYTPPA